MTPLGRQDPVHFMGQLFGCLRPGEAARARIKAILLSTIAMSVVGVLSVAAMAA